MPDDEVFRVAADFRAEHFATTQLLQSSLVKLFHEGADLPEEHFPIGSRLKTPGAIIAKLLRSTTRFTQMQDIAGARIVVPSLLLQDLVVHAITSSLFPGYARLDDQRENPDVYGYRAVHIVVEIDGHFGEIQIRSWLQDQWAQLVESLDSTFDFDLKHGRGDAEWLQWLHRMSEELRSADLGQPYTLPARPRNSP